MVIRAFHGYQLNVVVVGTNASWENKPVHVLPNTWYTSWIHSKRTRYILGPVPILLCTHNVKRTLLYTDNQLL